MSERVKVDEIGLFVAFKLFSRFVQVITSLVNGLKERGGTLDDLWKIYRSVDVRNRILDILKSVDINLISLRIDWSDTPCRVARRSALPREGVPHDFVNVKEMRKYPEDGQGTYQYALIDSPAYSMTQSQLMTWCDEQGHVPASALELCTLVLQNERPSQLLQGVRIVSIVARDDKNLQCPYVYYDGSWAGDFIDPEHGRDAFKILVRVS
ncbi:MAG: hypothetical protein PHI73_05520 [Patescibacteria group bacterium]|nr:hypothetical protein [Patescibacteria group bacterium]